MAPESEHSEHHPIKIEEHLPGVDQLETGQAAPEITQDLSFSRPQAVPHKGSSTFSHADRGSRERIANGLQRQKGNAFVQRIIQRENRGVAINRIPTGEEQLVDRIQAASSGGQSLDTTVQKQLESGIGADLSSVRVHTGAEADHLARSVDSLAFTTGQDIFFSSGAYDPTSPDGMQLLAHETTHTVQQSAAPVTGVPTEGGIKISQPSAPLENEAEHVASQLGQSDNSQEAETVSDSPLTISRSPISISSSAPIIARATPDEADQEVTKQGEAAAKGYAASLEVEMGPKSVIGDQREARGYIDIITGTESILEKAQADDSDVRKIDPLGANLETKFLLQQYETSLTFAGGAVSQFEGAYIVAAEDYGRIMGMAPPALKAIGINASKEDVSSTESITKNLATPQISGEIKKGYADKSFSDQLKRWNDARQDLVTFSVGITEERTAVLMAMNDYQAAWLGAQASSAKAKGEEAQAEVTAIKNEIAETAKAVGTTFKIATVVLGNLEAAGGDIPKELPQQLHSPEDLKKQITDLAAKVPEIKGMKVSDLSDPEKVVTMIGNVANEKKISMLENRIKKNEMLKSLNEAAEAAAKGKKPADILLARGKKLAAVIKNYMAARKNLKTLTDALAKSATSSGSPKAAMAFRFVAESEKGLQSVTLAVSYGADEQKRGIEALTKRSVLAEGLTEKTKNNKKTFDYYKYYTIKPVKRPWYRADTWKLTENRVDLKNTGSQSLTDTTVFAGPNMADSAQTAIAARLVELNGWKAKLLEMSSKIADAIGMPTPLPREAITPTPT